MWRDAALLGSIQLQDSGPTERITQALQCWCLQPLAPRLRDKAACTSAGDLPWAVSPKTKSNSADEKCGAIAKHQHRVKEREAQETMCTSVLYSIPTLFGGV